MQQRIVVRVTDAQLARVAWAIASHPAVPTVGMLGRKPPPSWKGLVSAASSAAGYDVVVNPDTEDRGALVVTAGSDRRAGITHASPEGLARSLTVGHPGASAVWTVPGRPGRRGRWWLFPEPLGAVLGEPGAVPVEGDLAGAGAFGGRIAAVVDDRRFLEAATLAGGALLAGTVPIERPVPVWEMAEDYLAACEELGIVIAEAAA